MAQHRFTVALVVVLAVGHMAHDVGHLVARKNLQRVSLERVAQAVLRFGRVQPGTFECPAQQFIARHRANHRSRGRNREHQLERAGAALQFA